ncbi:hypothetical protein DBR42_05340 [Pelomonas sp. HMWF004]|nr:hypothetical protein DBR42_05340 [Pelomonas sp. HMWF004]
MTESTIEERRNCLPYQEAMDHLYSSYSTGARVNGWIGVDSVSGELLAGVSFLNSCTARDSAVISKNTLMDAHIFWCRQAQRELKFLVSTPSRDAI